MEEAASFSFETRSFGVGVAEVLARPAAGPDFGFGDIFCFKRGDVAMQGNLWPVSLQYQLTVRINFAMKYRLHAGALEP